MLLDYVSILIGSCRFEETVEILLEQGRAQLWSEMRGLRSQLFGEYPTLANQLAKIDEELEALTTSTTPSARPEMKNWMDPFGRFVNRQQRLIEERDAPISPIRERPGLEGFMKTPSFTTLRTAASRGTITIFIHCEFRSETSIVFLLCSIRFL